MTSPGTATPYGYSSPTPHGSGRSGLAITALVLAIAAVVISTGMSVSQFAMINMPFNQAQLWAFVSQVMNLGSAVIALVALILGILAVRGARPAVSGTAIGIGAAHMFGTVITASASLAVM